MRKIYTKLLWLLIFAAGLLGANKTVAQSSGIFESYAILNINGAGNTFYDMQATTANPDFQGANLGTFCSPNTLVLFGGQNKTFKNGGCDITNGNIWYRVYPTVSPTGSYTSINEPFDVNLGPPGDQQWTTNSGTGADLLAGLTVSGNYTVEVYSSADYQGCGTGTHFSNAGGANYKATFNFNKTTGALAGTYNIPSACYPTLASFVTALNTNGVGGPVTANLLAGNPQTAPAGGYAITATGTAANTIVFTGNGNTITAFTPQTSAALNDAIFKIIGGDYITIQGFTMAENAANTTTAAGTNNMTEWGVALLYASLTDGAQNNTIQNNTISLNRAYSNTFGIYSNARHSATAVTTSAEVTAASGSNSNNKVYGNSISNVDYGIVFVGAGAAANMDNGNDIGGVAAGTGNTITNWGGLVSGAISSYTSVTGSNAGIYMNQQVGDNVSFNTVVSATNITTLTTSGFLGIFKAYSVGQPTGLTFTSNYNSNTITLTNAPTTSQMTGIGMQGLSALATATFNCNNNSIINCAHTGAGVTTAAMLGMLHSSAPGTFNINGNTIRGFTTTTTSTGAFVGIQQQTNGVVNALNINNNKIGDATAGAITFNNTTTTAAVTGISVNSTGAAATCALSMTGNDIRGITYATSGTGAHTYLINGASCLSMNISSNTFTNLNVNTTGSITFISNSGSAQATGFKTVNNNSIVTAFNKGGAGGTISLYTDGASSLATAGVQNNNNNFSNITVTGATTITGWFNNDGTGSTPVKTITGNTFVNWTCGTSSVIVLQSNFGGTSNISNNTISNVSGQGAVTGLLHGGSGTIASLTIANNRVTGISSTGTGGTVIGISNGSVATVATLSGNRVSTLSSTGASSGVTGILSSLGTTVNIIRDTVSVLSSAGATAPTIRGIQVSGGTTINIDSNQVNTFTASSAGSVVMQGINVGSVTTSNTRYNNINGLTNTAAGAASQTFGYNLSGGSGANLVANNFISGLSNTGGTTSASVVGIFHNTTVATLRAYYNTVYLGEGAALTGATNFGVTGLLFPSSGTTLMDVKSNIISVNATPNGTGLAAAVRRNTASAVANTPPVSTNFDGNNNIYNINAGAQNYLYVDATDNVNARNGYALSGLTANVPNNIVNDVNFNTSCGLYKVFMAPREAATFTENNLIAGPFAATFVPSGASFAESNGGVTTPATTNDYASITRGATPDAGALQFAGTATDASGPSIVYTNLINTVCLTGPTLTAVINDPSGVNTTAGTAPRLYFRKGGASAEADVFLNYPSENTSGFNGWKYVEATGTAPNFSFAIDYSLLTSPVAVGDSITYFVVAQDNNVTPNVGINAVGFASGFCPTSVNLPAGAAPTAGSKGYRILTLPSPVNTIASVTTLCGSGNSNLSLSTVVAGVTFQWQSSPDGSSYTDIAGATSTTYAATGITATTYYQCVFKCSGTAIANSVPVTVTFNSRPTVPVTPAGPVVICAPATQTLDASGTNAAATVGYQWINNGVAIGGANTATYVAAASGNYRVRVQDGVTGCFDTSAVVSVTINPQPTAVTISPAAPTVCAGTIQQLTANGGTLPTTQQLGAGTSLSTAATTTSTLGPNPLQSYYGGAKQQMIVTAAELTGLGLSNGSVISALAFNLGAVEARTLQNYVVKISNTALSAFASTTFEPAGTVVRNPANYTPAAGWNTITFDNNYTWNGTSNLLVEVNFSNNDGGGSGTNTAQFSTTGAATTLFYRVDNNTAAAVDAATTASFAAYTQRNNMRFTFSIASNTTWAPLAGLYTDAGATTAYTGGAASSVYFKSGATNTYTATASSGAGCSNAGNVTVTVTGVTATTVIAGVVAAGGATPESNSYAVSGTTDYLTACKAISTITPSGASPVTGIITNIVRVDTGANKMGTARLYAARFYDVMPATNAATATGTVKLYFLQSEFDNYNLKALDSNYYPLPDNGANTVDSLRILIYHGAPSGGYFPGNYSGAVEELSTADAGVSVVWNPAGNNGGGWWEVSFPANGFSGYFISSKPRTPLPIKVEYFRGAKQGSSHVLDWKVVPVNTLNGTLTLERSSDGRSFSSIYSITASAVRMQQPFNYATSNLLKGTNYYRLKLTDDNGVVTYSGIVALLNSNKGFELVNITPNPVTEGRFKLNITAAEQLKMEVVVTDMAGRIVSRQTNNLISGFNAIEVNVNTLANGMYQVMGIIEGERTKTLKFVKE